MKFQNPSIHRSKVKGRTHTQTDRQAKSNMPFQLFQSWGHKEKMSLKYFHSKHTLWVHRLSEEVLTSTHNVCFGSELENLLYPWKSHFSGL